MMWFLLLACPAAVLVLAVLARSGAVTPTDTACAVLDLRLDRQADLLDAGAGTGTAWVPQQRRPSRVADRQLSSIGPELLAG